MVLPTVCMCICILFKDSDAAAHPNRERTPLTSSGRGDEDLLRQVLPVVDLQQPPMVALKGAGRLGLVEYARARTDELVMELTLMRAALPAHPVQRLERPLALFYPIECVCAHARAPAPGEQLHRTQHALGFRRAVRLVIRCVQVLQG